VAFERVVLLLIVLKSVYIFLISYLFKHTKSLKLIEFLELELRFISGFTRRERQEGRRVVGIAAVCEWEEI